MRIDSMLIGPLSAVLTTERFSLSSAVDYMRRPSRVDPEVVDQHPVSLSVPDGYDVDLDAGAEWDWSDILLSREIDFRLRLQADLTVIREK